MKTIIGLALLVAALPSAKAQAHGRDSDPSEETQIDNPAPQNAAETRGWLETKSAAADETPEQVIHDWPTATRAQARALIQKYGEPVDFDDDSLVWVDNGPWKRTVISREAMSGIFFRHDEDHLRQTVAYNVPEDKVEDLRRFDRRLSVDESRGRLSSRAENEKMNFLAINLADDIVTGRKTVKEARDVYFRVGRLQAAGKSSSYTESFTFEPQADEDRIPAERTHDRLLRDEIRRDDIRRDEINRDETMPGESVPAETTHDD
jgi:hypothetical protein